MPAEVSTAPNVVVAVNNLTKKFNAPMTGEEFVVLDSISLNVEKGNFASIVGPSGCGKSTLLNIIAGIETHDPSDGGTLDVYSHSSTVEPRVGYVFQNARLLNSLTVDGKMKSSLESPGISKDLWKVRVAK